jgi:hypothetical protein
MHVSDCRVLCLKLLSYLSLYDLQAAWAELVLISMITPNASFLGHLCGACTADLYPGYFGRSF